EGKPIHLAAGTIGVALSGYGAGGVVGVVAPLLAVASGAVLLRAYGLHNGRIEGGALVALGTGAAALAGLPIFGIPGPSAPALWGGPLRHGPSPNTFEEAVKILGFGMFPVGVAVPIAVGRFVTTPAPEPDADGATRRRAWARLYVLIFAAAVFSAWALFTDRTT